jgi:hypothetical protein
MMSHRPEAWCPAQPPSELEPAVALDRRGNIIGLTLADAPAGSMPVIPLAGPVATSRL